MTAYELPMRGLGDARLAIHAAGSLPAWLWATDGTRVLWANPVAARLFGATHISELTQKDIRPSDAHRRQIVQLSRQLRPDGPTRLERLRGFGAPLGRLVTYACTKLRLSDACEAVLIVSVEPIGRAMPLSERLHALVADADVPLAAFGRDGVFVGANPAARALLGFRDLSEAGLTKARDEALRTGRTETPIGVGQLVLQRVGTGQDIGLIALFAPGEQASPPVPSGADTQTTDVPTDFFDEFADDTLEPFPDIPLQPPAEQAAVDTGQIPEDPAEDPVPTRTMPLRFVWEIDAQDHFSIASDDLLALIGPHAAMLLDAPWQDLASAYASYGRMASAIASQAAWSGIALSLPTDDSDEPLTADLSGIPIYRAGEFAGYRGFGVVHDLDALTRLDIIRRRAGRDEPAPQSLSAHTPSPPFRMDASDLPAPAADVAACEQPSDGQRLLDGETPLNVVHLRAPVDGRAPALTPVENNAFNELARELSARLEADRAAQNARDDDDDALPSFEDAAQPSQPKAHRGVEALLDLAPLPMAVHRDGRLLYANRAFLALSDTGRVLSRDEPFDAAAFPHARRVTLAWDGEDAEALLIEASAPDPAQRTDAEAEDGDANAEDFAAILDAADEAIVMFDAQRHIRACNRSATSLFGVKGSALIATDFASLFTPDTQVAIAPLLERIGQSSQQQTVDARTLVGTQELPLSVTIGRARAEGPNYYAIVRDITPMKRGAAELVQARRQSERASADKADLLARISHEMRSPLGAIIGFADVMIEQRFGPLGSDRYADYLRDIRGCGERVIAIVDDLLDLSRIESGKRDLAMTSQNLNDLVEQCVATLQPQANRERIIIRSSLAHPLPPIVADQASLRQIALNLIGNSIHLANAGGQVIVSTVHADSGEVLLRVRDTGHGLNDNEMATALAPFRPAADDAEAPALIRLSLTRALAEANQARFSVKPAPYAGTLIEVAFSVIAHR